MNKKEINIYIDEIKNNLVDKYKDINKSRIIINEYLSTINITEYDYNEFCVFLINDITEYLSELTENTVTEKMLDDAFKNTLFKMLINKIKKSNNSDLNETLSLLEIYLNNR